MQPLRVPEEASAQPIAGIMISPASENQKRPKAENAVPAKTSPFFQDMIPANTCANPPKNIAIETIIDSTGYTPM